MRRTIFCFKYDQMIRKYIYLLVMLTFWMVSDAQSNVHTDLTYQELSELGRFGTSYSNTARTFDNRYEGVKGSPLLYEEWQEGTLTMLDGRQLSELVVYNINAMESQIFVGPNSNRFIAVADSVYLKLEMGNRVFMPYDAEIVEGKKNERLRTYEVLWQNDDQVLLKREIAFFLEASYKGAYSADRRFDEYKRRVGYFFGNNGKFRKMQLNQKSVMKTFNVTKADLKKWSIGSEITESSLSLILSKLE